MKAVLVGSLVAVVDDEDYTLVCGTVWSPFTSHGNTYARAQNGTLMHRLITSYQSDVDHRNGCGLDNRQENLRPCTQAENGWNKRKRKDNTSGVKGVCWSERKQRWLVQIQCNGRRVHRLLPTLEEAKQVASELRNQLHKEFARDN